MRFPRLSAAATALVLVAGACGDSTGPQVELSDAEVEILFEAIADVLAEVGAPGVGFHQAGLTGQDPRLPGLFLSSASMPPVSFNATVGCAGGGNVTVSGSGNDNVTGETGSFDFDIDEVFNECVTEGGITVDGNLNLTGEGESTETSGSVSLDVEGNLTVTTPDASGSCRLDYGFSASFTGTSFNFEIHGTICGRNIEDIISQQDL